MPYGYIDDGAWPHHTSDGPHASWSALRTRTNVQQIHEQRIPAAGWATAAGESWRVCAVFPVAWPMGMIYLAEQDIHSTVEVTVFGLADWSVDTVPPGGGADYIRLAAQVLQPVQDGINASRNLRAPADADWTVVVDIGATIQAITLSAPTRGITGWAQIVLWSWSYARDEGYPADIIRSLTTGRLAVANLAGIVRRPPEQAVQVRVPDADKGGLSPQGEPHQVCDWWASPPNYEIALTPPVELGAQEYWSTAQIQYMSMGVFAVISASWRARPGPIRIPDVGAYHTDTPITERGAEALAAETRRLIRRRVPHWWGDHGQTASPCVRGLSLAGAARLTDSWTIIAQGLVDAPLEGAPSGYEAVVGVYCTMPIRHPGPTPLDLRLSAWSLVAGAWAEITAHEAPTVDIFGWLPWPGSGPGAGWRHTVRMVDHRSDYAWQFRHALLRGEMTGVGYSDDQYIQWATVHLAEGPLVLGDYPIRLTLQARQPVTIALHLAHYYVVACAARSLPLEV